ncbi:hypothetical protein [Pseudomonas sp. BF-R-01]|uniref:hypothetical protein n=1 Tax=Pseudomonas sp. BF-R-01 TaxID=2832365 RepID=UPI001CBD5FB5|nr:hypothetical protein [Pseudomonas sp. BF-R-01]
MTKASDISIEQAQFIEALKLQDEQYAWGLVSLYPLMIDALEPAEIKPFALRAATMLMTIACELGRRHEHTDQLISHIVLDLLPITSVRQLVHANVST